MDPHHFTTCGVVVTLRNCNRPSTETISHALPQDCDHFERLREMGSKFDATIQIGQEQIRVHKALMRARIPYFAALLDNGWVESGANVIPLSVDGCEFECASIVSLLDYAYTGHLTISTASAQDLMGAATYLQMTSAVHSCGQFMFTRILYDDALSLLRFFRSMGYHSLDDNLYRFIDVNFVLISLSADFCDLSVDDLIFIISRDSINVRSETQVFEAVDRWIGVDEQRKAHGERLLSHIHCGLLPASFVSEAVEKTSWVVENKECSLLLKDNVGRLQERYCEGARRVIVTYGDQQFECGPGMKTRMIAIYDPIANSWTRGLAGRVAQHRGRLVAVGDKVFYPAEITAEEEDEEEEEMSETGDDEVGLMHDTTTDVWTKIPALAFNRWAGEEMQSIGRCIFAAGGEPNEGGFLSSAAVFDTTDNSGWAALPNMAVARFAAASCAHDGLFYMLGGTTEDENRRNVAIRDVECFDPLSSKWASVSPMRKTRSHAAAASFRGHIIVVGGYEADSCHFATRCGEKYDAASDAWTPIGDMKYPRASATLVVACGRLFVLGGCRGRRFAGRTLNDDASPEMDQTHCYVEEYLPESDEWVERTVVPGNRHADIFALPVPLSIPTPPAL